VAKSTKIRAIVCLSVVLLAAAFTVSRWNHERSAINRASYLRIQPGMNRSQVEEILGGPPGDYCTEATFLVSDPPLSHELEAGEIWTGDDGGVVALFDPSGVVTAKGWLKPSDGTKWSLQRFIWRLGWWWEKLREGPPPAFDCYYRSKAGETAEPKQ
jgi:hypothetical protein